MRDRILGLLLFLPVPLVLLLFTSQPLGTWLSLAAGLALMATHRLYARPFALAAAPRRCLWCGGPAGSGPSLDLEEPQGRTRWRVCSDVHRRRLEKTTRWASRHARFLAAGILGSLVLFLGATALAALGRVPFLRAADAVAVFRLGVAASVLPFGWRTLGERRARSPEERPPVEPAGRLPFPVHVQALVGTSWVLWLFRLVGLWWLLSAAVHLGGRLA